MKFGGTKLYKYKHMLLQQQEYHAMLSFKRFLMERYVQLSADQLLKPGREGRATTLIQKIQDGDPFLLFKDNSKTVTLKKGEELDAYKKALDAGDKKTMNVIRFKASDGAEYTIKDLAKTPEFGGKGSGSGTRGEDAALSDLKKKFMAVLDKENVPFLYIKIGKKVEKVGGLESTPGVPKSDFHMVDPEGNEVFWISHKLGSKANDFQQYGGMPELKFTNSKDMLKFVDDVKQEIKKLTGGEALPPKTAFARKVTDKKIIMMTLFGKEYKNSPDSRQNIDVLYQGPMNLKRLGERKGIPIYTITSNHTELHGTMPRGEYEPYYYVRPEQAKNQFGIRAARFFIVAKLTATKNRNTKVI